MKRRRLVLVTWHDAVHLTHGWVDSLVFSHKNDYVHTVGWLLRKDKKSLTIAQSDGINTVANTMQIPVQMVERIQTLKWAKR